MNEQRSKAWYTRRVKYGPKGHSKGAYSQPYLKLERLALKLIVKLHNDGVLSEGQCSKALEMDRVHFRAMCDFMREENRMTRPHETGERDDNPNWETDAVLEKAFNIPAHKWAELDKDFYRLINRLHDTVNILSKENDELDECKRKVGEIALDWDIEKRARERLERENAALRERVTELEKQLNAPECSAE